MVIIVRSVLNFFSIFVPQLSTEFETLTPGQTCIATLRVAVCLQLVNLAQVDLGKIRYE